MCPLDFDWPIRIADASREQARRGLFCRRKKTETVAPLIVVVESIKYNEDLTLNKDNLFVIKYNGENHDDCRKPFRVEMTSSECPFQMYLNADAIKDYGGGDDKALVRAQLSVYDGKRVFGDKISMSDLTGLVAMATIRLSATLEFIRPEVTPEVLIVLDNEEIPFSRRTPEMKIGQIRVKSSHASAYIPELDINLSASLFGPSHSRIQDALTLGPTYPVKGLLFAQDIHLNMGRLKNPTSDVAGYEIECVGTYTNQKGLRQTVTPCHQDFMLIRDSVTSTLEVALEGKILSGSGGGGRCLLKQINFTIGSMLTRPYKLVFRNISSDDSVANAGVTIRNFRSETHVNGASLIGSRGENVESQVFNASGNTLQALQAEEGLFLPNGTGKDSERTVTVTFNPSSISKIKWNGLDCYLFTILCNIDFDYFENKNGDKIENLEPKRFHTTLEQRVYLEPNPEWLCVDYGSSAIVSVYDGKLLDMHRQKTSIIKRDPQYSKLSRDTLETNSAFLSSDILLHDIPPQENDAPKISSLSSEQKNTVPYGQLAVCLSPTSSMITSYFNHQLPCLKMLVGRTTLPHNPNYHIRYYCKKDDEVQYVQADEVPENSPGYMLSVMNVLRESYHTLFRYFMLPEIGELEKVNRLVLTYPNTYTPMHLSLIRNVVHQLFPAIRFDHDCMRFVSESDAVAAYYMRHWNEYHEKGADINKDENILVYDMGAGTLDVSILEKRYVNGQHQLKIVGKLGTCKAGNYLDFVIAKILCDMPASPFNPLIASTENNPMVINDRIAMKLAIKEQIKPKLGDSTVEDIEFTMGNSTYTVNREYIVTHPLFREYLQDTTTGMVSRICSYMGEPKITLNTVLMSGRSCRLQPLQEKLRTAVSNRNTVASCSFTMLDNPTNATNNTKDRSKLAVVEGAVAVADIFSRQGSPVNIVSKRLYGNYGVAFKGIQDRWNYIELLNHNEIPPIGNDEEYIFPEVKVNGLSAANKLQLVQSYMNAQETADQLNKQNMDYVSVMGTFNRGDFAHEMHGTDELDMRMKLTENDEIVLCLGDMQSVGQHPSGSDIESETTQRSFWPVRVNY